MRWINERLSWLIRVRSSPKAPTDQISEKKEEIKMDSRAASKKIHIGPANALANYQPVLMTHLLTPLVN